MVRIHRVEGRQEQVHAGRRFTLVSTTWTIGLGGRSFGAGGQYQRPARIESQAGSIPIVDHVFVARAVGVVLLVLATLYRRASI